MQWPLATSIEFAQEKVEAVLDQIGHLKSCDFPYGDPERALSPLETVCRTDLKKLADPALQGDHELRQSVCTTVNENVSRLHRILGFLLRATNVRNAFEIFDPIKYMAQLLLGPNVQLVLSSEWRFSPFIYPPVFTELHHFVFIGLPASESQNALIIPLAGHELGHSVWRKAMIATDIRDELSEHIVTAHRNRWAGAERLFPNGCSGLTPAKLDKRSKLIADPYFHAARHCEELFCDFLAIRLFGEGFICAFCYLVAPNLGGPKAMHYPSLAIRVTALTAAAEHFQVPMPADLPALFQDPEELELLRGESATSQEGFRLAVVEEVVPAMVQRLLGHVERLCEQRSLPTPDGARTDAILEELCEQSPPDVAHNIADIVNAGWRLRLDKTRWRALAPSSLPDAERRRLLSDLIFKAIEVTEYRKRLART